MRFVKMVLLILTLLLTSAVVPMVVAKTPTPQPKPAATPTPSATPMPMATNTPAPTPYPTPTAVFLLQIPLSPANPQSSNPQPAAPTPNPEAVIEVLKSQVEIATKYNDKILGNVTWFIGTFAGVFIVMQSISIAGTILSRRGERKALLEQVEAKFTTEKVEFDKSVEDFTTGLVGRVNKELGKIESELLEMQYSLGNYAVDVLSTSADANFILNAMFKRLLIAIKTNSQWHINNSLNAMIHLLKEIRFFVTA